MHRRNIKKLLNKSVYIPVKVKDIGSKIFLDIHLFIEL